MIDVAQNGNAMTRPGRNTTETMNFTVDSAEKVFYLVQVYPLGADGMPVARRLGASLTIGRAEGEGVTHVLADQRISRVHAQFRKCSPGPYVVLDLESKNGVHVGGVRIASRIVDDGSLVRIGGTTFVVRAMGLNVPEPPGPDSTIVGWSPCFRQAVESCRRAAPADVSVLIAGETGTGKELLARYVHERSGRRGRFVPVNCAAVSSSLFESAMFGHRKGAFTGATEDFTGFARHARNGTLFLDEVGELPLESQAKLLRFLESGEVATVGEAEPSVSDVRVVAATNRDLAAAVDAGAFRKDLLARLAQWVVRVPPLRDRPEDVILLASAALARSGRTLTPDVAEALVLHDWPMNARELFAVLHPVALEPTGSETAAFDALPPDLTRRLVPRRDQRPGEAALDDAAHAPPDLERLLAECDGNVSEVARRTGKDRRQVYRWLARAGLKPGGTDPRRD